MAISRFTAQADRKSLLRQLTGALFAFETLPGRYALTLREPRILFDFSHEVLLMAMGRPVDGLALESFEAPRLKRAACFFVRNALLRAGADHYTLLGLEPGFHKDALRNHYRMLIRLTHPDFVGTSRAWPTGSATRINLAHDVLSSVVRRAEYDQALGGGAGHRSAVVRHRTAALPGPGAQGWLSFRLKMLPVAGIAAAVLLMTLWPDGPEESGVGQIGPTSSRSLETVSAEKSPATEPLQGEPLSDALKAPFATSSYPAGVASKDWTARDVREIGAVGVQPALAAKEAKVASLPAASRRVQVAGEAKDATSARTPNVDQAVRAAQDLKASGVARSVEENPVVNTLQRQSTLPEPPAMAVVSVQAPVLPVPLPQTHPAGESIASPRLVDAQPALNQLIQSMQTGRGEALLRGLEASLRDSGGAAELVNAYNLLVSGSQAVRLGRVQLRGRSAADQLAVDGVVQLVLQDQGPPPPVRELQLRAVFAQRGGRVVMTELSAGRSPP